jgi:predicted cobalt transporter CbtA
MPEAAQQQEAPKIVRMPINPAQIQSVGVGGMQFSVQAMLQSPFFWMVLGAGATWFVVYTINKQKK